MSAPSVSKAARLAQQYAPNNRLAVLSAYRNVLRATYIAFRGDNSMLTSSHQFARDAFRENRGLQPGSVEAEKAVEHALGVAQILKENVVQGSSDVGAEGAFKLNIHEHTERGDNESIKQFKGTGKKFSDVKCCSS